jgi:hypothetical protein
MISRQADREIESWEGVPCTEPLTRWLGHFAPRRSNATRLPPEKNHQIDGKLFQGNFQVLRRTNNRTRIVQDEERSDPCSSYVTKMERENNAHTRCALSSEYPVVLWRLLPFAIIHTATEGNSLVYLVGRHTRQRYSP